MEDNIFIKASKAIEELGKLLQKAKKESRYFRFLFWWSDLKFDIRRIFKGKMQIFARLKWWFEWRFIIRLRRIFKRRLYIIKNYLELLRIHILMKIIKITDINLITHMVVRLPLREIEAAKIIAFIQNGSGDTLIKFIDNYSVGKGRNLHFLK